MRGRDVEEGHLVGPLGLVARGRLDRIPRVAEVLERDALHDAAVRDVQARNDAHGEGHEDLPRSRAALSFATVVAPPCNARPKMAPRGPPASARSTAARSSSPRMPPDARISPANTARTAERSPRFGPVIAPSHATSVTSSVLTPRAANERATNTAPPAPASSVHPHTVGRPSLQSRATTMRDTPHFFLRRCVKAGRSRNGKLPTTARAVLHLSKNSSTELAVRSPPPT